MNFEKLTYVGSVIGTEDLKGTGDNFIFKDEDGNRYLVKPAVSKSRCCIGDEIGNFIAGVESGKIRSERYRCEAQELATVLQYIITPETAVECKTIQVITDTESGKGYRIVESNVESNRNEALCTIQPIIPRLKNDTDILVNYYNSTKSQYSKEEENIVRQILKYYVIDFLLADYDSKPNNFIIDKNGNVRRIDTEQALKYISYRPDPRFGDNPNARYGERSKSIYRKIFKDIEEGNIPADVLDEIEKASTSVLNLSDEAYLDKFKSYIKARLDAGKISPTKARDMEENILQRRNCLRKEIPDMIQDIRNKAKTRAKSNKLNKEAGNIGIIDNDNVLDGE